MADPETSTEPKGSEKATSETQQGRFVFLATQVTLRVLAVAFTLVSISVMATSDQTVVFDIPQTASYRKSSAYLFLLIVNAVVCAFSLFSLIFVWFLNRSGSSNKHNLIMVLHVHDLVMVVLMMSGCAAGSAAGYLGKYGQWEIGWVPVCGIVRKYCRGILVSLVFAYLSFFCYFALALVSAYNYKLIIVKPVAATQATEEKPLRNLSLKDAFPI